MSIHIDAAVDAIVSQAVNDANDTWKGTLRGADYRPYVEACVAAETAELRVQVAELKLANHELRAENAQLRAASAASVGPL